MNFMRNSLLATLTFVAGSAFGGTPEQAAIDQAKAKAAYNLKDPNSAQFRGVRGALRGKDYMVCGEMNAKNSYGAYVGFQPFMVWGDLVFTSGYSGDRDADHANRFGSTKPCATILEIGTPPPTQDASNAAAASSPT